MIRGNNNKGIEGSHFNWSYLNSNINRDDPTPEETEAQRMMAEGKSLEDLDFDEKKINQDREYSEYMRFHRANDLLGSSEYAKTPKEKANWLQKLGYQGVNVRGLGKPISFEDALSLGKYNQNIHLMFIREIGKLSKIKKETRNYLERTGFFNHQNN